MAARRLSKKFTKAFNQYILEQLEDRTLLTNLVGGDVFEFQDNNNNLVRVAMSGDISADFIGAYVDEQNVTHLYDIPGHIYSSSIGRANTDLLGGVGGAHGVQPVNGTNSPTTITDPEFPQGNFVVPTTGNAQINLQALASNQSGDTYAFNVGTASFGQGANAITRNLLQLVQLRTSDHLDQPPLELAGAGTVKAMFQQGTLAEDVPATLSALLPDVQDVAIDPASSGLMYVVDDSGGQATLYRVDRLAGTVTPVGAITNQSTGLPLLDVRAMAFTPDGQLYILTNNARRNGNPFDTALVSIDKSTGRFSNSDVRPVTVAGNQIAAEYTGMAYDATAGVFYAAAQVGTGTTPVQISTSLHRITLAGAATDLGAIALAAAGGGGGGGGAQGTGIAVEGLAFALDAADQPILVGVDVETPTAGGAVQARLLEVSRTAPGTSTAISELGSAAVVHGLTSVTEFGDTRPLLFSTNGASIFRGSPINARTNSQGVSIVNSIQGADFDPATGLLYFTTEFTAQQQGGGGGGTTSNTLDELYVMDVNAPNRSAIQNSIRRIPGTFGGGGGAVRVTSIAFDPGGNLIGFAVVTPTGGAASGRLVTINTTNTNLSAFAPTVTIPAPPGTQQAQPTPVTDVTGIEFVFGDEMTDPNQYVIGVTAAGGGSEVLRIDRTTGTATEWGPLPDPTDRVGPVRGANLGGLTWDPVFRSPFTGDLGALLATDVSDDELLVIDTRLRPPQINIFEIRVSRSDANSFIAIAEVPRPSQQNPTAPRAMRPFTGSAGPIRVINGNPDPANPDEAGSLLVSSAGGSGTVYIGATLHPVPGVENTGNEPITSVVLDRSIGEQQPGQLTSGLQVTNRSLLEFVSPNPDFSMRLLGYNSNFFPYFSPIVPHFNLDRIGAMAISPNGAITVIDTDNTDPFGQVTLQDEMAPVDPLRGNATGIVGIHLNGTTEPLRGVQGASYGDLNQDGTYELYAIYNINGVPTLGQLIDNPGVPGALNPQYGAFVPIGPVGVSGVIGSVRAMAFANDGLSLYVVDDSNRLLRINPTNGAIQSIVGTIDAASIKSMAFGSDGKLVAFDPAGRQLVTIDPNTALTSNATGSDSIPSTVGAIAFDRARNRWLAVDNSYGALPLANEATSPESAALMVIRSTTAAPATQDLGKFLLGGAITGAVNITGSIDTFYAGWIITGEASGLSSTNRIPVHPGNFSIGGDARNILTKTTLGGTATLKYTTGTDIHIGGSAGQIRSGESVLAGITVDMAPTAPSLATPQTDTETTGSVGFAFERGELSAADPFFENDSFDTAEFIATAPIGPRSDLYQISVSGEISYPVTLPGGEPQVIDATDYYAVPLMAGQLVTVQLVPTGYGELRVGVFDPDGRLIATDYNDVDQDALGAVNDPQSTAFQPFSFRADRPGVYRVAVGIFSNIDFVPDAVPTTYVLPFFDTYTLNISGVGALGLAGVVAAQDIEPVTSVTDPFQAYTISPNTFLPITVAIDVRGGDLGALVAGRRLNRRVPFTMAPEVVDYLPTRVGGGNLRAMVAPDIGGEMLVPNGSVGLVKSTGNLSMNWVTDRAIGGDYQMFDVTGAIRGGYYYANRGIGVVRAGSVDLRPLSLTRSFFAANYDNVGQDGIIDLFDVSGDFLGPAITTGFGGNVRYIRVGGLITRDPAFGGGTPEQTDYAAGETVTLTDDSGTLLRLIPQNVQMTTVTNPDGSISAITTGPAITQLLTYPIRGSGGAVLVSFNVNGPIQVDAMGTAGTGTAEISMMTVSGAAIGLSTDPTTGKPIVPAPTSDGTTPLVPLNVGFSGSGRIDVLQINGGTIDNLINSTGGEIVNATLGDVGVLQADTLGVSMNHTGAAVNPTTVVSSAFPFLQQHTAIQAGTIAIAQANRQLGNFILSGNIGDLIANADRKQTSGDFEGIVGPIVAGDMFDVQIGAGLLTSGTGAMGQAGLYSNGTIHNVTNQGLGSDIHGDIAAVVGITNIALHDGAILGADIAQVSDFNQTREPNFAWLTTGIGGPVNQPFNTIQGITLSGTGAGMMGTTIVASNIGPVNVQGFGIFNSRWLVPGAGTIGQITAGGYGIRGSRLSAGANVVGIVASGNGAELPVTSFTPSARASEVGLIDPYTLQGPSRINDLHAYLGTSGAAPVIPGVTTSGLIEDVEARSSRNLGNVRAYQIRGTTPIPIGFDPGSYSFVPYMVLNAADSISTIQTASTINTLYLTTGRLGTFKPGSDVFGMQMVVSTLR